MVTERIGICKVMNAIVSMGNGEVQKFDNWYPRHTRIDHESFEYPVLFYDIIVCTYIGICISQRIIFTADHRIFDIIKFMQRVV